ncbi:DUF4190 domain-containing protein [Spirilliplanes yamanashiensis]|uniref:DUF4190 domain-containing protein n=1 Tax=Spirilliplanes yamanashiensis TaxID=42233 RepID=UPI001951D6E5|nr:DUF4190 domain-containing protein [Spirilliplanes yamanashiensis]MDP9817539.1 hypothetical protein [Spirilliplanes yamanashiensis]
MPDAEPTTTPPADATDGRPAASPAARPPLSGLAVAALATSLTACAPLSIGLGLAALARIRRGQERGRGIAVAGMVAGTLALAAMLALNLWPVGGPARDAAGRVVAAGPVGLVHLRPGDCVEVLGTETTVSELPVVGCREAHAAEVVSVGDIPYPARIDDYDKDEFLAAACADRLAAYAPAADRSTRAVPLEPTWLSRVSGRGDVVCLAVLPVPQNYSLRG